MIPKKIIDDYDIYCVHSECEWIGKLGSLEFHLQKCLGEKKKKIELAEEFAKKKCIVLIDEQKPKEIINIEESEKNDEESQEISLIFSGNEGEEQQNMMFSQDLFTQSLFAMPRESLFRYMMNSQNMFGYSNVSNV